MPVARLRALGLALATCAVLVLTPTAAASTASKVVTVLPESFMHLKGSDLYCTVVKESVGPVVACFHDPGGPGSAKRKGYALAASDSFAAVEPPASNTPVKLKAQPSLKGIPVFRGGKARRTIIELGLNDLVAVGGTHMAVLVTTAKGGGNAIGVVYLDGNNSPIVGTYTVGISNHFITIVQISGPNKATAVYRHSAY